MIFAVPLGELGRSRSLAWMPVSTGPTTGPVGSINAHPVCDVAKPGPVQCIPTGDDCQCTTGHWFRQSDGAFYDGSKFQPVP